MKILIDTNILCRIANADDPDQQLAEDSLSNVRGAGRV